MSYQSDVCWPVIAAPYLIDLLTFAVFLIICQRVKVSRHWVWLNFIIIGLISPLINSAYNYLGGLSRHNDVHFLLSSLPSLWVHLYFITTLLLYLIGLTFIFLNRRRQPAPNSCMISL
ncbi:MAG TPA: hypothetical protein VFK30_11095 [Anaerolineae bacterium]|nr:hypothetical protein [Anaerolineae bacterium]